MFSLLVVILVHLCKGPPTAALIWSVHRMVREVFLLLCPAQVVHSLRDVTEDLKDATLYDI